MTYDRLDDEFQAAWKAGLAAERCEEDLARTRWLLVLGAAAVAGVILIAALSSNPAFPRPDLYRRWVIMGAVGLTFILTWATCRRMPARSFLTALGVFVAGCTYLFILWGPTSEDALQLYLWSLLLWGQPFVQGALTALQLRSARRRCPDGTREAREQVAFARKSPSKARACLERARDLLPPGGPLRASVEEAVEVLRSGGTLDRPEPRSSTPPPRGSRAAWIGVFLGGTGLLAGAPHLGLAPALTNGLLVGGFVAAEVGISLLLLLRDERAPGA